MLRHRLHSGHAQRARPPAQSGSAAARTSWQRLPPCGWCVRSADGARHTTICGDRLWENLEVTTATDLRSGRPVNAPLPLLVLGRRPRPRQRARRRVSRRPAGAPPTPAWSSGPAPPRRRSGDRVFVLGHHYQRDEVIEFADVTGDSFKLAKEAAARPDAQYIVFCGVHFMAESADILTNDRQQVILPDLAAGCSMADMAAIGQVDDAWDDLVDDGRRGRRRPGDLHELLRGDQGVHRPARRHGLHLQQRRHGAAVGLRPARRPRRDRQGAVPARPAPRAATPPSATSGSAWRTASSSTRTGRTAA